MESSQKYWQYARDCAWWASQTEQDEQRETGAEGKSRVNVALADDDVAREALFEPKRQFIPDESRSQ